MNELANSAPSFRELALPETDAVTGGLLSVATLESLALQKKLSNAYMSHQESELNKKIEERFEAGFGR
jgi:hypothetical protein